VCFLIIFDLIYQFPLFSNNFLFQDCGWSFSSASKLKRHQQKHTNERKFQCIVEGCGKSFMRSEHLKEHKLTHVGQRNFKCPYDCKLIHMKVHVYQQVVL